MIHLESLSRNVNLYGSLSALALSGVEDLVRRQLEYTHLLVEQGARQWRRLSEQASGAQTPEQWSQLMQDGVEGAVETMRDCMAAASEHHAQTLRSMQQNVVRTQDALAEVLVDYAAACAAGDEAPVRGRSRAARASTAAPEKRAA